jgi:hypothetical protein
MAHAVRRLHAGNAIRRGLAQMIRQRPIVTDPSLRARGGTRARAFEAEPAGEWPARPSAADARRRGPLRQG